MSKIEFLERRINQLQRRRSIVGSKNFYSGRLLIGQSILLEVMDGHNTTNPKVSVFWIGIIGLCFFMGSCSSTSNKQLAEQAVSQFHQQLDSEQYHVIYSGSDERLRQASSEAEFVALLEAVHRKLGKVQQANVQGFQVGWFAGQGQVVTLVYNTRFADSPANEKFVWHITGDHPLLVGYFINSNALITK